MNIKYCFFTAQIIIPSGIIDSTHSTKCSEPNFTERTSVFPLYKKNQTLAHSLMQSKQKACLHELIFPSTETRS